MPRIATALLAALALLCGNMAAHAADCRPVPAETPARAGEFSRGLLWKIESDGVAPSHLFGTYHSNDPRITRLPCPVEEAFARSKSYTLEVIFNGAGMSRMAEAMFFRREDNKTLKQLLGEPLYQDTLRAVGQCDESLAGDISQKKPWAVMMMLSSPKSGGRGLFLDLMLQARAIREGKANHGLESMDEQIAVFNGMSLEDQVVLLRDAVKDAHLTQGALDELTQAYLQRDLSALVRLSEKYKGSNPRAQDELMRRLLTERNHNMAKRMPERLKEGNAFIAVGALHLPGEDGLLQLLSKAGYRVTRVY
jgi:hypothetical protein